MKLCLISILLASLCSVQIMAADPVLEAFAERYAKAKDEGDAAALMAMHYMEGATEAEVARVKESVELGIKYKNADKHTAVTIDDKLNEDIEFTRVSKGEKVETSLPPAGMITITYPKGGHMAPYGLKDGRPWLLGVKITKLDWNGPAEDFYQVSVTNSGDTPVDFTIEYAYKASGLSFEKKKQSTVKAHGFKGTSIIANEVLSVRISTSQPDVKLEAVLNRNDSGKPTEILKKSVDSSAPFVFEGKKP
ncbi:hypothetical protein [Prosthecobacter sp.]|jgi:hypothetical protein|uniref:hypothetical protein n=1 Tax=Prosthecobacter sp. TaxID=1965333 RepID=UPI0037840D81